VPSITQYPSSTPGINQHNPPWQTGSHLHQKKKKKLNKQQNWKLAHSRRGKGSWNCIREGGGRSQPNTQNVSKQTAGESTVSRWWTTGWRREGAKVTDYRAQSQGSHSQMTLQHWGTNREPLQQANSCSQLTDHWPCPSPKERGQGKDTSP
jgi:hypothetical protein